MRIEVYSRPGIGDDCDMGRYEYNGSFSAGDAYSTADDVLTPNSFEGWARMMDCFQEVLFVIPAQRVVSYSRTWEG
jgi:hypothetical protein